MRSSMAASAPEEVLGEVSADRLLQYTAAVSRWVRLSGSPEEALAFHFIEETLRSFGLQPRRYLVDAYISLPGPAMVKVIAGDGEHPLECITHSFAEPTPPDGVTLPLVYAGQGSAADYSCINVRGALALVEGLASPDKAVAARTAGAAGFVAINDSRLHEMIVSPVWGTPPPEALALLPHVHAVSVRRHDGEQLKELVRQGPVSVWLQAQVETGWRRLPTLVADLEGTDTAGRFVLFSGHVDSWHYGAMDNGSANATQLELARILSPLAREGLLRRGLRLAFWSGHSHGRYAGSAWYADAFWNELHERCVAHVNVDSTGSRGASLLTEAPTMAETYALAREAIETQSGQELAYRRIGRMGDQSFWGHGIPSLFVSLSQHPYDPANPPVGGGTRSGGLGPCWHTPDDTLETIDAETLARDTRIYLTALWQLLTRPLLPLEQTRAVAEIRDRIEECAAAAGDRFDLTPLRERCSALMGAVDRLQGAAERAEDGSAAQDRINACLLQLSRCLIPVSYTVAGPFGQDPALPAPPLPGLAALMDPSGLAETNTDSGFLRVRLLRERNRIEQALIEATRAVAVALG